MKAQQYSIKTLILNWQMNHAVSSSSLNVFSSQLNF